MGGLSFSEEWPELDYITRVTELHVLAHPRSVYHLRYLFGTQVSRPLAISFSMLPSLVFMTFSGLIDMSPSVKLPTFNTVYSSLEFDHSVRVRVQPSEALGVC